MRKRELIVIIVSIIVSAIAGLGAILPLKWMIVVIVAIGFIVFLLIVRDAERVLLFALTLIIPFHIGTGLPAFIARLDYIGPWNSIDVQFIDILVVSLLMCRLARLTTHRAEIQLYPFTTVPALAWLVASALSAVNAKDLDLTVMQIGQMAKLLLLYIVVASSIKDKTDIKWVIRALLLGVLFEGLLGFYQQIAGGPLGLSFLGEPSQLYYERPRGTIGHPNGYAMYLAATLPVALALLFLEIRGLYK
ncbi:MAG: hypothetical protein MUO30_13765, partial [Anaerolineales bacterium]|nr:hypothetical protein [Anaerolineales bacterium]